MAGMRRCIILASLMLLAITGLTSATHKECELSGEPVCGTDGIEYTNACIADAQGVHIEDRGECPSPGAPGGGGDSSDETSAGEPAEDVDPGVYIDRSLRITEGSVPLDVITAYVDAEYFFVGEYRDKAGSPDDSLESVNVDGLETSASGRRLLQFGRGRNLRPRGATWDRRGRHYVQRRTGSRRASGGGAPRVPRRLSRSLLNQTPGIVGPDDLHKAPSNGFPFSAVVNLVFDVNGKTATCTAAFINPSVLVTAASCLYNVADQYFYSFDSYSIYTSNGKKLQANADTAIVTTQFILGLEEYDVGLLVLDSSYDAPGYLGYGAACKAKSSGITVFGYPEDEDGDLYKSRCSIHAKCGVELLEHHCDLEAGMTGGPLVDKDEVVRGVAIGTTSDHSANAATALTGQLVDWISEAINGFQEE